MKASALRFLKKRSTLEYKRYRKKLLSLESIQKASIVPPSGGFFLPKVIRYARLYRSLECLA